MRRRLGYTLLEVLVATSIIFILGGIAYASLGPARESARQRSCASNLRQIGIALRMYIADNEGVEPNVGVGNRASELGLPPVSGLGSFIDNYIKDRGVLRCPNYKGPPGATGLWTYWWGAEENGQMPEAARFSSIVKARGGEAALMGCELHHPEFDISLEPRWTLKRVIFLRLNGEVENKMKPLREYSSDW